MKLFFFALHSKYFNHFKFFSSLPFLLSKSNVFVSKSHDIFKNLAFEEWLFQNYSKFVKDELNFLFLWFNSTAAVIGRHQNPWNEVWIKRCFQNKIPIVRRNSGGGTVIHDLQNLNISFISHRSLFNRSQNMNLIKHVLKEKYKIESYIGKNFSLYLAKSGFKISGTAAKVGSKVAYHHCTLLVNSDLDTIYNLIRPTQDGIHSNATPSIPATVENLKTHCSELEMSQLINYLSQAFVNSQPKSGSIIEIEPNEEHFSGIKEIETNLKSWNWTFGKTPKFSITSNYENYHCQLTIYQGLIQKIEFFPSINSDINLNGVRLIYEEVESALNQWYLCNEKKEKAQLCNKLVLNVLKQIFS